MDMLQQLASYHEVVFNSDRGKSLVSELFASTVGVNLVRKGEGSRKVAPGIATLLGIGS